MGRGEWEGKKLNKVVGVSIRMDSHVLQHSLPAKLEKQVWQIVGEVVKPWPVLHYLDGVDRIGAGGRATFLIKGGQKQVVIVLFWDDSMGGPVCAYVWPEERVIKAYKQRWARELFVSGTVLVGEWVPKRQLILLDQLAKGGGGEGAELVRVFHQHFTPDPALDPFEIGIRSVVEFRQLADWWKRRHEEAYASDIIGIVFDREWVITAGKSVEWMRKLPGGAKRSPVSGLRIKEKGAGGGGGGEGEVKWMTAKYGGKPDVWWVKEEGAEGEGELAYIGSSQLSRKLQQMAHRGENEVRLQCVWVSRHRKWQPLLKT